MHRTYAVSWKEPDVPRRAGKLELRAAGLSLEGSSNGSAASTLLVAYDELVTVRLAPTHDRLDGRPTLMLERRGRGALRVASIAAPGIVSEIAERVGALCGAARGS